MRGVATGALAAGIPHAEAAGLLVDAAADADVVFVLDDLERLPAWEMIGSVVRFGPRSMRRMPITRPRIRPNRHRTGGASGSPKQAWCPPVGHVSLVESIPAGAAGKRPLIVSQNSSPAAS